MANLVTSVAVPLAKVALNACWLLAGVPTTAAVPRVVAPDVKVTVPVGPAPALEVLMVATRATF